MPLRPRMLADRWDDAYVVELERHIVGLRDAGVSGRLTQALVQRYPRDAYLLTSASNVPFGTLRGEGSAVAGYEAYVEAQFPDDADEIIDLVVRYAAGVRESGAPVIQLVTELLVRQRTAPPPSGHLWRFAAGEPRPWDQAMEILGLPTGGAALAAHELNLRRAVVTWHAFTQELLRCTAFPANDRANETVTLVRTEGAAALRHLRRQANGAALTEDELADPSLVHGVPLVSQRGALEPSSLYTVRTIHGNVVTECVVPHHRIFSLYLAARPKSVKHQLPFFGDDRANEVTFMPEGLPFRIKAQDRLTFARPALVGAFSWSDL